MTTIFKNNFFRHLALVGVAFGVALTPIKIGALIIFAAIFFVLILAVRKEFWD